ncbi:MAG: sialidase family protein [Armatimonadota bacterium]
MQQLMWSIVGKSTALSPLTHGSDGISLHEKVAAMPNLPLGEKVRLLDGRILALESEAVLFSDDEGASWETLVERPFGPEALSPCGPAVVNPETGTILTVFIDEYTDKWTWSEDLHDTLDARMSTYAARSTDGGRTWQRQLLYHDWNGDTRNMIRLQSGRVVFSTMKLLHHPGRHGSLSCYSDDDGLTWTESNIIDLGGNGHHDGAIEAPVIELNDGRLLLYLRTNWGQFWRAESRDRGQTWLVLGPAGVEASAAPALLTRLQSGRVMLLWNRPYPEAGGEVKLWGGDRNWSATPVSNFRDELSVAFSDDDCESWSAPVVIARKADTWLAYPRAFEAAPGVLWITTLQGDVRLRLREADFTE